MVEAVITLFKSTTFYLTFFFWSPYYYLFQIILLNFNKAKLYEHFKGIYNLLETLMLSYENNLKFE